MSERERWGEEGEVDRKARREVCADLEAAAERAAGGGAGGDLGLGRRADVHLQLGAVEAGQRHVAEDHAVPLGHLQLVAPALRHLPVRRQVGVCQSQNTTVSLAETDVTPPLVTSPYGARSASVSHKTQPVHWRRQT